MDKQNSVVSRKVIAFISSFAFIAVASGISVAIAAITLGGSNITGDSSFNSIVGVASTTFDVGSSTLSLQTTNGGPITLGPGLFTFTTASGTNVGLTGYLYSANASTSNVSSTNQTLGGYLIVSGASTLQGASFTNASGTNLGLTGYNYTLGNLGVGTTTTSNLLFLATSSPIFVVSSTGQIMIATTSIPQVGALFTVATSSNIFSVLPGAVNVSTTLTVTGQTALQGVSLTNASGTNLGLTGYLYANSASTTNQSSTNITVANNLQVLGTFSPTNVSSTALTDTGYALFSATTTVGTTTAASASSIFTVATSTNILYITNTGVVAVTNASTSNASTTNQSTGGFLQVTGQTTLGSASGTSIGLSGAGYFLGNLAEGTTTSANLLFLATSSPIFVVSSTGQIMIATTSIPQVGALFTVATSSNIFSVLPGAVNVSTTLSVTGQSVVGNVSSTNQNLSGYLTVTGQSTLGSASGTSIGLSGGYLYNLATTTVGTTTAANNILFSVATTTNIFRISGTNGSTTVSAPFTVSGAHINVATTSANLPTVATCGTSPAVQGSDSAGVITVGTGGTTAACTLTFGTAYSFNPVVVISGSYTSTTLNIFQASTTGFVASSSASFPSEKLYYTVIGNPW